MNKKTMHKRKEKEPEAFPKNQETSWEMRPEIQENSLSKKKKNKRGGEEKKKIECHRPAKTFRNWARLPTGGDPKRKGWSEGKRERFLEPIQRQPGEQQVVKEKVKCGVQK